jgi:hypothetical protein
MYRWPGSSSFGEIAGIPRDEKDNQRIKADGGLAPFDPP